MKNKGKKFSWKEWTLFGIIILFVLNTWFFMRHGLGDDECIVFQYAKNISSGHGWTFNQGMTINGCTSVSYPIVLACISFLGLNIASSALWITLFFLACTGIVVYFLLKENGYTQAAYLAPAFIVIHVISIWSLGLETTLALCLSFLSIYFYFQNRYTLTTVLLAITVLTRPDTVLLAGILFFHYFFNRKRIPFRQLLLFILLLFPWIIFSWMTFKSFFPNTLYTKTIEGLSLNVPLWQRLTERVYDPMPISFTEPPILQMIISWFFIMLLFIGMIKIIYDNRKHLEEHKKFELIGILLLWGVLHITGYIVLHISKLYRWHMAPVAAIYCIMAAVSMESVSSIVKKSIHRWVIGTLFLLIFIPEVSIYINYVTYASKHRNRTTFYLEAAKWFKENTPRSATIGAGEVGVIGYYSGRTVIDMVGLVTPGISKHIYLNDPYWGVRYYKPDYLMIFDPPYPEASLSISEPWWKNAYSAQTKITFSDSTFALILYKKTHDNKIPQANDYAYALIKSIGKKEVGKVKSLLEIGADPNIVYPDGNIPLIHATYNSDTEIVQLLLKKGADVNKRNKVGGTALMDAASAGNIKLTEILLAKGADPNVKTNIGWTALLGAVLNGNAEIIKLLLEKGADPNAVNNDGNSPLGVAALNGRTEIVKQLLAHGADYHAKNKGGGTPLRGAIWKGHTDIVQLLKQAGKAE